MTFDKIVSLLQSEASLLLEHTCRAVPRAKLKLPSPTHLDEVFGDSNRSPQVLKSLASLCGHGRLSGTGYLSILPVDQGIEHTAGASFALNPAYFDPENILRLAIEGGCSGIATTLGTLSMVARKYAHKIPFIVKINHNELLTHPHTYDQTLFGSVRGAWELGATAIGATIYFGHTQSRRQIREVAAAFEEAHALGMATVLWCYLRNEKFKVTGSDYHEAADVTGQANYLGATLQADIIKQKLPVCNGAFPSLKFGKTHPAMYDKLVTAHPIDLCRYQVLHNYVGRIGLINSGGASQGTGDLAAAVRTAVINKRAGGMGLIAGRKAFQRPFSEGVTLLHAIQDVYLAPEITIA